MINAVKIVSLFVAIWMTIVNMSRLHHKCSVSWLNFILQAAGITIFIYLQWLM